MLIIGNGTVVTRDEDNRIIENGAVVLEGDKIKEIGDFAALKEKYTDAESIDVQGKIIAPGLINSHMHIYSSFGRGMSLDGGPNDNFLKILDNQWWRMDKALTLEDVYYSAITNFMDSVRYGVTTGYDHHASPFANDGKSPAGSLFKIADAAKDLGFRASLAYEVTDRDGEEVALAGIKENMDFINEYNNDDQTMVRGMFGMHASFTLSDKTMEKSAEAMAGNNAGYHIHVAEGIEDLHDSLKKHGKRLVYRLHDYDILGEDTIAVHCIYVNQNEMQLLADTKTNVVHNPESNMGNAVGTCPAIQLMATGVPVGLGTDSYTTDMFESMKVANILHKHDLCDPTVAWVEVPQMVHQTNPALVKQHFGLDMGSLKPGYAADVIVLDYRPYTPFTPDNINGHYMFGFMGKHVTDTIIAGKPVMRNRVITTVDEEEIFAKAKELSKAMWERA